MRAASAAAITRGLVTIDHATRKESHPIRRTGLATVRIAPPRPARRETIEVKVYLIRTEVTLFL